MKLATRLPLPRRAIPRRLALTMLAGSAAAPLLPAFVSDAAPLVYDLKPQQLDDGIWLIAGAQEAISRKNGGAIANVVILDTSEGAVIVDTGPSKRFGEQLASLSVSNQNLAPEKFENLELGAKWDITPELVLAVVKGNASVTSEK